MFSWVLSYDGLYVSVVPDIYVLSNTPRYLNCFGTFCLSVDLRTIVCRKIKKIQIETL